MSAYDSSNLSDNRGLGRLIKLIEAGEIEHGSIIIIEALDRLTRATPLEALSLITRIVSLGVDVFTTIDNQHFSKDRLNSDPSCLFLTLGQLLRGHDESEKKSNRSKAWVNHKKEKGECWTGRRPYWIDGNPHKDIPYSINNHRGQIVKEVYRLAKTGYGSNTIAKMFNTSSAQEFKRDDGKIWYQSSITKFLINPAVYGLLETKDGDKIPNYYPALMTEDEFLEVRTIVSSRGKKQYVNANLSTANLFSSLVYCRCGAGMRFGGKVRDRGVDTRHLKCLNVINGGGCDALLIPYQDFETELLYILYVHLNQRFGKKSNPAKINAIKAKIAAIDTKIKNYSDAIATAESPSVINLMVKRLEEEEANKKNLELELNDLRRSELSLKHVQDRRDIFENWQQSIQSEEARRELIQSIRLIVNRILVDKQPDEFGDGYQYRNIDILSEIDELPFYVRKIKMRMSKKIKNRLNK